MHNNTYNKNNLKCKIIWWEDFRHTLIVTIEICGCYYHTDLDPYKTIQEEELYEYLTLLLDVDEEQPEDYKFEPHLIQNEEVFDFKYYNNAGLLTNIVIQ